MSARDGESTKCAMLEGYSQL